MEKRIQRMKNHYIVCGLGRTGRSVAEEFSKVRVPFVVVDHNQEVLERYSGEMNFPFIVGDATDDDVLKKLDLEHAKGLVAALDDDASNLFVTISARDINPRLRIVSRADQEQSIHKLFKAGADNVVSPSHIGGLRMASAMIRPNVVSFLDVMMRGEDVSLRMEEAQIPPESPLIGKTLQDARIPQETGLMVVAIKSRNESGHHYNPKSSTVLHEADILIVLGNSQQVEHLRGYLAKASPPESHETEDQ